MHHQSLQGHYRAKHHVRYCICMQSFTNEAPEVGTDLLLAIGQLAVFTHSHRFLLNVVLGEQTRLTRHHLADGSWNHHVLDCVIGLAWLPSRRGNHLEKKKKRRLTFTRSADSKSIQIQSMQIKPLEI